MNPRIKELAEQVGAGFNEGFYREIVGITMSPDKLEKFAELIVKECAFLVEGFILEQEVALDDYQEYEASAVLKEHFGIKE
jgi:sugar diacid utilization regulator